MLGYMVLFLLIGSLVTHFALVAENKKRLAGKRDHLIEGKSEQEIEMLSDNRYVFVPRCFTMCLLTSASDRTSSTRCRASTTQVCHRSSPVSMCHSKQSACPIHYEPCCARSAVA